MFSIRHYTLASLAGIVLMVAIPGCQPERPDVIPSSAQIGSSGNGTLHFIAPNDGMVYVYDQPQTRLIWSGHIGRGEAVDVDPQRNRIMVAGNVRANKVLVGSDHIDIYFDAAPTPAQVQIQPSNSNGVTVTPNVTVQPSNGQTAPGGVTVQPGVTVSPTPPQQNP
jgi:hypothetical protein